MLNSTIASTFQGDLRLASLRPQIAATDAAQDKAFRAPKQSTTIQSISPYSAPLMSGELAHEPGSTDRKYSAACSGSTALKYVSLMLYDLLRLSTIGKISICQ